MDFFPKATGHRTMHESVTGRTSLANWGQVAKIQHIPSTQHILPAGSAITSFSLLNLKSNPSRLTVLLHLWDLVQLIPGLAFLIG